ncbi:hypothetical protein R3P38DRAFT_3228388 [Favolaschia claudopus]|uniref:Uncharacterized protein n=1 Tax=Favolaschia claudopus TaxID=2862362 RepID=A0AAV9ZR28_9AGAR
MPQFGAVTSPSRPVLRSNTRFWLLHPHRRVALYDDPPKLFRHVKTVLLYPLYPFLRVLAAANPFLATLRPHQEGGRCLYAPHLDSQIHVHQRSKLTILCAVIVAGAPRVALHACRHRLGESFMPSYSVMAEPANPFTPSALLNHSYTRFCYRTACTLAIKNVALEPIRSRRDGVIMISVSFFSSAVDWMPASNLQLQLDLLYRIYTGMLFFDQAINFDSRVW